MVAQRAELVGGDESGDAATEDDDADAVAGLRLGGDRLGLRCKRREAEGLHAEERRAESAGLSNTGEKGPSGKRHERLLLQDFPIEA